VPELVEGRIRLQVTKFRYYNHYLTIIDKCLAMCGAFVHYERSSTSIAVGFSQWRAEEKHKGL